MKKYFLVIIAFITALSLLILPGCKYDVTEPIYSNSDFVQPPVKPNISTVQPAAALPGVNTISFSGENIDKVADDKIYWEIPGQTVIPTDIIEKTSTFLTVRRPNLSSDSCVLKLVPDSGLVVKFGPYKIDGVIGQFGSFVDYAVPLAGITVDNTGNIFVVKGGTAPFATYKVTPDGQRITIADSLPRADVSSPPTGAPTGIALSQDGYLVYFRGHRHIQRLNTSTGVVTSYHQLRTNRQLRVGAFDSNGILYASGNRVGLWVIKPDSTSEERSDLYPTAAGDSIWAMHVYNNYLYMAVGSASGHAIVRHSVGADGSLGQKEPVLDVGQFTGRIINDFAFASDGKIFISIDGSDSFIVYDPASTTFDYFYKDITPPYCRQFSWGSGNYIYIISGRTDAANPSQAQDWTVYRVDMGITGE